MTEETFEMRVAQYRQLDALIKQEEDAFKETMVKKKEMKAWLRSRLLDMLNRSGQDSSVTTAGTVYKNRKETVSLEDPDAFKRHVIGGEDWDLVDWKANLNAVRDFAEANKVLPPGVKLSVMLDIGVRAPTKLRKKRQVNLPEAGSEEGASEIVESGEHTEPGEYEEAAIAEEASA